MVGNQRQKKQYTCTFVHVSMTLTHECEIIKYYKIHICWVGQAFLQTFDMETITKSLTLRKHNNYLIRSQVSRQNLASL